MVGGAVSDYRVGELVQFATPEVGTGEGVIERLSTDLSPYFVVKQTNGRRTVMLTEDEIVQALRFPDVADIEAIESWLDQ